MAAQAKIVSFDEAKTVSGKARPSVAAPKRSASKRPSVKTAAPAKAKASTASAAKQTAPKRGAKSKTTQGSQAKVAKPSSQASKSGLKMPKAAAKPKASASKPKASRPASKDAKAPVASRSASRSRQDSMGRSTKRATSSRAAFDDRGRKGSAAVSVYSGERDEDELDDDVEVKRSRIEKMKRSAAKNKAGKAFTRQFGSGDSDASATGGSRAALYKGEMGKKHKQSTRMQGNPGQSMGASKKRFSGPSLNPRSPKFVASLMVAACLVLSCVFLYPAAKQYYTTVREHDQLQAEYEALQQRNATIQAEVDSLSTEAGIEDRARKEFGWVKEGENAANVYGLDTYEDESTYNKAVTPGSVEAPDTWYSPVLDILFGVE